MSETAGSSRSATDEEDPLGVAVMDAVSAHSGVPMVELPPLYHVVDPDALDALFSGRGTVGHVTFQYSDCAVTVRADRTIDVSERDGGD